MLGKTLPIAVCCLAFVIGCEKKEPEAGAPSGRSRGVEAPPGMVLLSEQPPVFMTAEPVSVAQYVQYLKATGVPEGHRPGRAGAAAAGSTGRAGRRTAHHRPDAQTGRTLRHLRPETAAQAGGMGRRRPVCCP